MLERYRNVDIINAHCTAFSMPVSQLLGRPNGPGTFVDIKVFKLPNTMRAPIELAALHQSGYTGGNIEVGDVPLT